MKDRAAGAAAEANRLKERGNLYKADGKLQEAAECYRRALQADPGCGPALYNLGVVLQESGRLAEAEEAFRGCRALDPRDRDALFRLGLVLAGQARHADAADAYREALAIDRENPLLWLELAKSQRGLRRGGEALECAARAVQLKADFAESRNLLGILLQEAGRVDDAISQYEAALALEPGDAGYLNNLGSAHALKGTLDAAVGPLRRAVELQPRHVEAHSNLGNVYGLQGRRDLAARSLAAAHALAPASAPIAADLLFEMRHIGDWSRLAELSGLQRRNVSEKQDQPVNPFSLLSIPSTRAEQLQCARTYARRISEATAGERERLGFRFERRAGRKLRIGYLSSDLHEHATGHLMAELFELHDRGRFEVIAYSYGPDDASPMRARLLRAFDRFRDVTGLSHADAARAIHADSVDVLFDLKGYTTNARPEIMALRPAPVQVSYIGYPGSMGADFIDYLVGDRIVTPAEHAPDYSEKLLRLPGCYQVNDRRRAIGEAPPRRELGLPESAVVFCCFNQIYKILPATFEAWMRVLAATPGSVLWLLAWNPHAVESLRREAAGHGIDPARLIFAPLLEHRRHLDRVAAADLLLDTLPYNAHTVASDALWCGVPVLTCPGETFASRVAASQLAAAGLPELIAGSMAAYEAAAVRLARNPAELSALRRKVAANRATCALFDAPAFTRALEHGIEQVWELHAAGRPPAPIDVP